MQLAEGHLQQCIARNQGSRKPCCWFPYLLVLPLVLELTMIFLETTNLRSVTTIGKDEYSTFVEYIL